MKELPAIGNRYRSAWIFFRKGDKMMKKVERKKCAIFLGGG